MKILLTTDGSEYSDGAARFLTRLNFSPDDEITIVHAVTWTPIMSEWESLYSDVKKIRYEIAPKILDAAVNILKAVDAKISTLLIDGHPEKAIVDAAIDSGVDLVVMGARGLRGIASLIVGSVTKSVAIRSPKPVLVIKPPQWEISEKIKVLFATDGSAHSDAIGGVLSSIPFPDDTEITILNVISSALSDIPERFAMEINDRIKEIVAGTRSAEFKESEKIIGKAHEYLSKRYSKIEKLSKSGEPPVEILNTAETLNTDIIAVGSSGMRGIRGMLGSVSRNILNQSKCSVLVGKTG